MNGDKQLTSCELDRLVDLSIGYRDGVLEDAEVAELDGMLAESPAALDAFVEMGMLVAELSNADVSTNVKVELPKKWTVRRSIVLAATACSLALVGFVAYRIFNPSDGQQIVDDSPRTSGVDSPMLSKGVARLIASEDASIDSQSSLPPINGDWLERGPLEISSGHATLIFDSGAEVHVQAPAQLELIAHDHARLAYGRISCRVPDEAQGFRVVTPRSEVIDRGTEFVLDVLDSGTAELHVVEGLVDIRPVNSEVFAPIRTNEAVRCQQSLEWVDFEPDRFTLEDDIQSDSVRFVHWGFDDPDPAWDASGSMEGGPYPLEFVGSKPRFVRGVFGSAWQLSGQKDGAVSAFAGISGHAPRTITFWCRIPRDAAIGNNYAMIGWGRFKDSSKWVLGWNQHEEQGVIGALRTEFGGGYVTGTLDLRDGRWHHIASVWMGGEDADVATHLRLYIDGVLQTHSKSRSKRVATVTDERKSKPVTMGLNLNRPRAEGSFLGDLDEVYVFDRALLPGELRKLITENTPPPSPDTDNSDRAGQTR